MEGIIAALLAGAGGSAIVIAILRWAGPAAGRLVGGVLKTRAELDADRDRIIDNLREEIGDMQRRLDTCTTGWAAARAEAVTAKNRVAALEGFIDRFLERYGLNREAIEHGEAWPTEATATGGE